jgi:GH15 family glucan-1,4-alpha-glucosidase
MTGPMDPQKSPASPNRTRIEDYAIIGNFESAALISKRGSIDWLCWPRFDSGACFAALLGSEDQGHWSIFPDTTQLKDPNAVKITRRYRRDTLILETEFETPSGKVRLTDCMPQGTVTPTLIRTVQCLHGEVPMLTNLVLRFDYGSIIPWVTKDVFGSMRAIAGPDAVRVRATVPLMGREMKTVGNFTLKSGQKAEFIMTWFPSSQDSHTEVESPDAEIDRTALWWKNWTSHCTYRGPYADVVKRSLITLKALTHQSTGGIVAAPTTSLPEALGGSRNWDYRYCWLRDSTYTLYALLHSGYTEEARHWKDWLLRAVAGSPSQLNIMYGVRGERRLTEVELPWLAGYEGSQPVRQGNGAYNQLQLDVFGELMGAFDLSRQYGIETTDVAWKLQRRITEHLETLWFKPDNGIWEVRGEPRHFVFSKAMAWLAFDRSIRAIECSGLKGPLDRWTKIRDQIHAEICEKGFDPELGTFVQSYGSKTLDASLLSLINIGFLPPNDPRLVATVAAIKKELMVDGFVLRYKTEEANDGLPGREGVFLACTFWLVDALILQGKRDEAQTIFERAIKVRNDLGLLSEEYDTTEKRLIGNFPQGFSHISLINSACSLAASQNGQNQKLGPAQHRSQRNRPIDGAAEFVA